jgi:hypothetical protein
LEVYVYYIVWDNNVHINDYNVYIHNYHGVKKPSGERTLAPLLGKE